MTRRLLVWLAILSGLGLAGTYLVLARHAPGVRLDQRAFERLSGGAPAPYTVTGERTLRTIDVASVAVALLALTMLALVRGHVRRAAVAGSLVVGPVVTAELLKRWLPVSPLRPQTFPSGHTAIAVGIGLALVVAVPAIMRVAAALAGAAYSAAIAFSVVALGWHYPSDALGSFFLCGLWAGLLGLALSGTALRPSVSGRAVVVGLLAIAGSLAVAAEIAAHHPVAVASVRSAPAVAAAAAFFGTCALVLFAVVTPLVGEGR